MKIINNLLIINLNLIFFCLCEKYEFSFELRRLDEFCLSENFPGKTLVIYKITSTSKQTRFQLRYEDALKISKLEKELLLPFTTDEGGNYEICIIGLDKNTSHINFSLKYGIDAKDYSSLARNKDLKPIDLALEKLDDRAKDISKGISFSQSKDKNFEKILDRVSSKVIIFSIVIICFMLFVGYLEVIYLKNFMKKRKLI